MQWACIHVQLFFQRHVNTVATQTLDLFSNMDLKSLSNQKIKMVTVILGGYLMQIRSLSWEVWGPLVYWSLLLTWITPLAWACFSLLHVPLPTLYGPLRRSGPLKLTSSHGCHLALSQSQLLPWPPALALSATILPFAHFTPAPSYFSKC